MENSCRPQNVYIILYSRTQKSLSLIYPHDESHRSLTLYPVPVGAKAKLPMAFSLGTEASLKFL